MLRNALLVVVTVLYAGQACAYVWTKDYPQAVILSGYAFANIGLIMTL